ncbi:MAG: hypothetical protein M4D80_08490 [Myxococcota bacterium]|nr:hypothetical protein [Myxococcota bacterium]
MGKSWLLLVLLAACQPMYGAAPQKLRTPEPIKSPTTLTDDPAPVVYNEDCDLLTSRVATVKRDSKQAEVHTQNGDQKVADYDVAPPAAKKDLMLDGIDEYVAALKKDPFNAKATLKLAVAYDKARRKGCALRLLERLDQLAQNPKLANEANEAIDELLGRRGWFKDYRREALRKVGRTNP